MRAYLLFVLLALATQAAVAVPSLKVVNGTFILPFRESVCLEMHGVEFWRFGFLVFALLFSLLTVVSISSYRFIVCFHVPFPPHPNPLAAYRFVDVDVTHQAPAARGRVDASAATTSLSSYEVAVFDVHFNQPVFFRGLPLPDLNTFLGQHHNHHHILDDSVQLICDHPPSSTGAQDRQNGTKKTVVSSDPFAPSHTADPRVYLVPLAAATKTRFQWLRALAEPSNALMTGAPLPSQQHRGANVGAISSYVNWNRVSFAVLLRSWVSSSSSSGSSSAILNPSAAAATSMEELVKETSSLNSLHNALLGASERERFKAAVTPSSAFRASLLERVHLEGVAHMIRTGQCKISFLPPHDVMHKHTPSPVSTAASPASEKPVRSNGVGVGLGGGVDSIVPPSAKVRRATAFATRRGVPFAGDVLLLPEHNTNDNNNNNQQNNNDTNAHTNPNVAAAAAATATKIGAGVASFHAHREHHHLLHQHDSDLAFLAESVDIQGQVSIPFLSILLSPIVDFVKEQVIRRSPDYIKWRMRTDMFKRLLQQVISTEIMNGVQDNDFNLSILTEMRAQARREMGAEDDTSMPRFQQVKTGVGAHMTVNSMLKAGDNPDPSMLKPDGCLPNPIIHHLIETMTKILSISITEKIVIDQHDHIANIIAPSLLEYVLPTITDSLPNSVIPMVAMTLQYTIPPIVKRLTPLLVIKHVTTAITDTLTRGVVHVLAPTLSHTLRDAARIEPICYYCYYVDPRYCYICPQNRPVPASSQAHLDLYTIDYFVDYYTDYYADFYTGKTPLSSSAVEQKEEE